MMKSGWMAIGEASKYLGISRDTLRRWEKAGKIKPIRSPTNRRYYTKEQLDKILSGKAGSKKPIVAKTKAKAKKATKKETKGSSGKLIGFGLIGFLVAALIGSLILFLLAG